MKPFNVTLWVYADSEEEANALQHDLHDFAMQKYNQHIYPRAEKLSKLIKQFGNSAIVNNYLM